MRFTARLASATGQAKKRAYDARKEGFKRTRGFIVSVPKRGGKFSGLELIKLVDDGVSVVVEILGNEAALRAIVAHAQDQKFDLSFSEWKCPQ